MSAPKLISIVCLVACFLKQSLSEEPKEIRGKPGENVTLQCQGPNGADVKLLKWIRTDLQSDQGYVYFSRMQGFNKEEQHPSFLYRVELADPHMKDGNVSVILKNVTINDTGTYECYVGYGGRSQLISTITLTVRDLGGGAGHTEEGGDKEGGDKDGGDKGGGGKDGGNKDGGEKGGGDKGGADKDGGDMDGGNSGGHVGLTVGVTVVLLVVVVVVVGFVIDRKRKGLKQETSYESPADKDNELQSI